MHLFSRCRASLLLLAVISSFAAHAQTNQPGGRVVLVLPFDNRSGQATLDWIGESFADTLNQRLRSAGFLTISRDDRVYALDHLGLPEGFRPTRATTIRIAQTLDAQFVVVGSYAVKDGNATAQAQVLEINRLTLSKPLEQSAALPRLLDVENNIAWLCARQMDPKFAVSQAAFEAASAGLKLDAYESYIRGLTATTDDERLKRLKTAADLSPTDPATLLALGKDEFTDGDYDDAAAVLGKVPANDPAALEANFYRGLARFNSAHYADAEGAFALVGTRLPLPEVINNQGVAMARQHKEATALLQRASSADPLDADYHFNVAVAMHRRGDNVHAKPEIDQAVKLRPIDGEAKTLQSVIAGTQPAPPGFDPQERIRRTYSEAAFRQAAFQMDQMRAARIASLPADKQADEYAQAGQEYLNRGLVLEAEREFQAALAADSKSATGHLGLAQVRERSGNADEARKEVQLSLETRQTASAYLTLARLDLAANENTAAGVDVGNALRIEPQNSAALSMRSLLANRGVSAR